MKKNAATSTDESSSTTMKAWEVWDDGLVEDDTEEETSFWDELDEEEDNRQLTTVNHHSSAWSWNYSNNSHRTISTRVYKALPSPTQLYRIKAMVLLVLGVGLTLLNLYFHQLSSSLSAASTPSSIVEHPSFSTYKKPHVPNAYFLQHSRGLAAGTASGAAAGAALSKPNHPNRILYIVTTLAEYNSGTRNTVRGSDRLQETLIPVLSDGVRSLVDAGYHVDVFLVCHFELQPARAALIRQALPDGVGLDHWSDATPLGYDTGVKEDKLDTRALENRTLHLARQHRFVIKDRLLHYDMFVNFEDDMLVTAAHVQHYAAVTEELRRLEALAPDDAPSHVNARNADQQYHGVLTKGQLRRMMPGLLRVEVLLDEREYGAQTKLAPVPVDMEFTAAPATTTNSKRKPSKTKSSPGTVNATVCCHVSADAASPHRPPTPTSDQLMIWETNILPLGVRQMPADSWLDWVVLQRGPNQSKLNVSDIIGDYWSNRNKDYFGPKQRRPSPQEFKYINNQGGWMATREQLWRWHTELCPGGFLPPYEAPHYQHDGLDMRNVEWYSGGMQLSTVRHACNLQRIVQLEPEQFSKSLLYHSANNKQRQLKWKKEEMFTKANTLLGQLNTIKKRAEADMAKKNK